MKKVNLVYFNRYSDVDIISVPDSIADQIQAAIQEFFTWTWTHRDEHSFGRVTKKGDYYVAVDTDEFIWWLNNHKLRNGEQAVVVRRNCFYRPWYPRGEL